MNIVKYFFRYTFKLRFNEILDSIKFNSCRKCIAFDYNSITRSYTKECYSYTYRTYCKRHSELKRLSWKAYHIFDDPRLQSIPRHIRAELELNSRLKFSERFALKTDSGHAYRNRLLHSIMNAEYKKMDVEAERKKVRLSRVLHQAISIELNNRTLPHLLLDKPLKSEAEVINDASNDWNEEEKIINQCDQIAINRFLFEHYYKRGDLKVMNALNLILLENKKTSVEEEEDWN